MRYNKEKEMALKGHMKETNDSERRGIRSGAYRARRKESKE